MTDYTPVKYTKRSLGDFYRTPDSGPEVNEPLNPLSLLDELRAEIQRLQEQVTTAEQDLAEARYKHAENIAALTIQHTTELAAAREDKSRAVEAAFMEGVAKSVAADLDFYTRVDEAWQSSQARKELGDGE